MKFCRRNSIVLAYRLHCLAKVQRKDLPLRSVPSLPGSVYDEPNKWLVTLFYKVAGANIETATYKLSYGMENFES